MGFFDQNKIVPVDGVLPITKDRIKEQADALEWSTGTDEDGDILGGWEFGSYLFTLLGENENVLMGRGNWYGTLPAEKASELEAFVADWNRNTVFPKAYTVSNDEGQVRVVSEMTMDYQHGITDRQLSLHLWITVSMGEKLFEGLAEEFPEGLPEA